MNNTKQKSLAMTVVATVVFLLVNLGVWMASRENVIDPIGNMALWGGFVILNVVSILWAINLLGLNPLVVALSYVGGGLLAYKGVSGMQDVSAAEITTAGATYGAFGAMAVGNAMIKVRLAFFNKAQVPFVFIILALLVLDAGLNSGVSSASGGVLLNAVVLPFIVAGVVVGLAWSVIVRFGVGKKASTATLTTVTSRTASATATRKEAKPQQKTIVRTAVPPKRPEPAKKISAEKSEPVRPAAKAEPAKPAPRPEPVRPAAKAEPVKPAPRPEPVRPAAKAEPAKPASRPEPVRPAAKAEPVKPAPRPQPAKSAPAEAPAAAAKKASADEPFFPLEIDKNDDFILPGGSFKSDSFDGSAKQDDRGGVMVKEPEVQVSAADKPAPAAQKQVAEEAKVEKKPEQSAEKKPEQAAEKKPADWLNGHLDLLNKLK